MADINPYQAPRANVSDMTPGEATLAAQPRTVDAGRGIAWLLAGWERFRQVPLVWVAITVIGLLVFIVVGVIPVLGSLATPLLSVLFGGGIMLGCRAMDRGEDLTIAHLFAGFQSHLNPLLVMGALYLAGVFAAVLIASIVTGGTMFAFMRGTADWGTALGSMLLLFLVVAGLMVPIAMAIWFAPALSVLHDIPPAQALKLSFFGCLRNIVPFLVYGVLGLILSVIATIPFGLGWLVLLPVMAGSVYAAYRDIFVQP